ncbi:NAD-dependent dehydratase [Candidatus Woesearchaeota archaeon]|nr:NAD-dependent dehydratase [Candidatus Woesearchaeota archaeon]
MKRIVVTGGAGFIGSYLCESLLNENNLVICVDNFFTGNKKNIRHLLDNKNFEVIEHDITEPLFLDGINQIYNLACPASPIHYQFNAIKTIKTNVLGTINMLEIAKNNRARILQASTSEIYGNPFEHPQKETYFGNVNTVGPRACYDEGKRVAETLMFDYNRQNEVDIRIARIFNTYGPRMAKNDGRVISNFINQTLNSEDITIYGDGSQTRSFCYVSDTVDGLIRMMNTENLTGPVNLGNPTEMTILDLAKKVIELTNSKSKITFNSLPVDDPVRRCPDISLAKEKLNWEPKVPLEEGLEKIVEYYKSLK